MDTPLYGACPNLYRWMLDLQNRDSNPFNLHGGHIYSHFMQAFGEKYKRIMPCRYFASHKLGLPRDLVMEPSGSSPRAPPSLYPSSILHIFGQGITINSGPYRDEPKLIGSLCHSTVAVEMVLLELGIPYVLHLLPPSIPLVNKRAPWCSDKLLQKLLWPSIMASLWFYLSVIRRKVN